MAKNNTAAIAWIIFWLVLRARTGREPALDKVRIKLEEVQRDRDHTDREKKPVDPPPARNSGILPAETKTAQ